MIPTRAVTAVAAASLVIVLAGCTAVPAEKSPPADPQPVAAALPSDEQMCWAYSDALTLFLNMRLADGEGRLIGNEWDGIQRLTMRMVDGIPLDESTEVGAALAALQKRIPDAHTGSLGQAPDLSDTWSQGTLSDPVQAACAAAVPDWGIEGWVGG
jgi:hypothetical protein